MKISTAIILAGGLGTRLRPVVTDVPKCMAPVGNKPFLAYVIASLQKEGISKFIFSLGYKSEIVINYLENKHPSLQKQYAVESEPLGTGGAIQLACSKIAEEDVVVVNGDTLFNIKLSDIAQRHIVLQSDCTIALKHLKDFSRYGTVEMDGNHRIQHFHEKKYCESGFINGGIYVLHIQKFLSQKLQPPFSFEKDFLEKNITTFKFYGVESKGFFIDIGIPEDYKLFQEYAGLVNAKTKSVLKPDQNTATSFEEAAFLELIREIFQLLD